jgi:hypothetical protein
MSNVSVACKADRYLQHLKERLCVYSKGQQPAPERLCQIDESKHQKAQASLVDSAQMVIVQVILTLPHDDQHQRL